VFVDGIPGPFTYAAQPVTDGTDGAGGAEPKIEPNLVRFVLPEKTVGGGDGGSAPLALQQARVTLRW